MIMRKRIGAILLVSSAIAAGMLALGAYRAWARRPAAPGDRFNQLATKLQLDANQKTRVQQIFGDTRQQLQSLRKESEPKVTEIRQQTDKRLQEVLTPAQGTQCQQMRDETRARRAAGAANR